MEIPNHECDECGSEGSRFNPLNCFCNDCLQEKLDEAEENGKTKDEEGVKEKSN